MTKAKEDSAVVESCTRQVCACKHLPSKSLCHVDSNSTLELVSAKLCLHKVAATQGLLWPPQPPDGKGELYRSTRILQYLQGLVCPLHHMDIAFAFAAVQIILKNCVLPPSWIPLCQILALSRDVQLDDHQRER